jgi:hypothetical protein
MGFNTVAVIYNDHTHRLAADDGTLSRRIADAMRSWSFRDRDRMAVNFGAGMICSQAHADHDQIVVVGQNQGRPLSECNDLDFMALHELAKALERHGWKVKEPKR